MKNLSPFASPTVASVSFSLWNLKNAITDLRREIRWFSHYGNKLLLKGKYRMVLTIAVLAITLLSCAKQKVGTLANGIPTYVDTVTENLTPYADIEGDSVAVSIYADPSIPILTVQCGVSYDVYDSTVYQYTVKDDLFVTTTHKDVITSLSDSTNIRNVIITSASYKSNPAYFVTIKFN